MSEEAKVRHADEAIAIVSSGQKDRVKSRERFCKNFELDSNNRDVDRDSSDESDIDESSMHS